MIDFGSNLRNPDAKLVTLSILRTNRFFNFFFFGWGVFDDITEVFLIGNQAIFDNLVQI